MHSETFSGKTCKRQYGSSVQVTATVIHPPSPLKRSRIRTWAVQRPLPVLQVIQSSRKRLIRHPSDLDLAVVKPNDSLSVCNPPPWFHRQKKQLSFLPKQRISAAERVHESCSDSFHFSLAAAVTSSNLREPGALQAGGVGGLSAQV